MVLSATGCLCASLCAAVNGCEVMVLRGVYVSLYAAINGCAAINECKVTVLRGVYE